MTQSESNPLATLRRFARLRRAIEHCELCGQAIGPEHEHLVKPESRQLLCACQACAVLFAQQGGQRKFIRVPRRVELLPDFRITDAQWEGLHLPINLAFFFYNGGADRVVAMYPGPAGATESLLSLDSWRDLTADNPVLAELEPDAEALLVNRIGEHPSYARVPIDECYKLVGIIRTHWRGLSGGTEVWHHIAEFYASLKEKSAPAPGTSGTPSIPGIPGAAHA